MVAAALLFGSGTAIAAPDTVLPVASTVSSAGGTGGEACAYLPSSLQELLCPSAGGEDEAASSDTGDTGGTGGAAAGGTSGSGSSAAPSAATGGATGDTGATGTSGSSASPPGVVSNFLIWLAGLFQYIGL